MACKGKIGLDSGTVKLVAHHPKWAEYFSKEKLLLFKMLGEKVLDIRHIGSTSIPGIPAKPIIDILAAVKMLADVEAFAQDLNKIGYEDKGSLDEERLTKPFHVPIDWSEAEAALAFSAKR